MSGSRKSLSNAAVTFNPRAANAWSNDDSKFGQRMLEKMGWVKGHGIGLHGQGTAENISIRFKKDNKGLGFKIRDDQWVGIELKFTDLLSQLNQSSHSWKHDEKSSVELSTKTLESRVNLRESILVEMKPEIPDDIRTEREKEQNLDDDISSSDDIYNSKKTKASDKVDDFKQSVVKFNEIIDAKNPEVDDGITKPKKKRKIENFNNCITSDDSNSVKKIKSRKKFGETNDAKSPDVTDEIAKPKKKRKLENDAKSPVVNDEIAKPKKKRKIENCNTCLISDNDNSVSKIKSREKFDSFIQSTSEFDETNDAKNPDVNDEITKPKKKRKIENSNNCLVSDDNSVNEIKSRKKLDDFIQSTAEFDESIDAKTPEVNDCIMKPKKKRKIENFSNCIPFDDDNSVKKIKSRKKFDDFVQSIKQNDEMKDAKYSKVNVGITVTEKTRKLEKPDNCISSDDNFSNKKIKSRKKFDDFMQSVIQFNKKNDVQSIIQNFEETKEKLMNKYKENYRKKSLLTVEENDGRIYCDLDGLELDCKAAIDEEKEQALGIGCSITDIPDSRKLSKAERIIFKARLLKNIQSKKSCHDFDGSNLNIISGYGIEDNKS